MSRSEEDKSCEGCLFFEICHKEAKGLICHYYIKRSTPRASQEVLSEFEKKEGSIDESRATRIDQENS